MPLHGLQPTDLTRFCLLSVAIQWKRVGRSGCLRARAALAPNEQDAMRLLRCAMQGQAELGC